MSTGNMPNPPDQLTAQALNQDVKGQTTAGAQPQSAAPAPTNETQAAIVPQLPLHEDMARIIEEQVGVIAQRLIYHSQMLLGVSALGTDPVSARDVPLAVAQALRQETAAPGIYALVNAGDAQIVQINDRTFPYRFNSQVAGLIEGILADTISYAYKDDKTRQKEARLLLNSLFLAANDELQIQAKITPMMSQAPAMGNDMKALTQTQAGPQSQADAPVLEPAKSTDKG